VLLTPSGPRIGPSRISRGDARCARYGGSGKPHAVEAYAIKDLYADIADLVTALGETRASLIGHDWGAPIVWNTALFHQRKCVP
jgi:pimeloyl-ACP methyl ester carboxylesterase